MREGLFIKVNWIVLKKSIYKNLELLGVNEPKKFYKAVKKTYRNDLNSIPEFSKYDILKLNLVHSVMIGAIYKTFEVKPSLEAMTEFYKNVVFGPKVVRLYYKRNVITSKKSVRKLDKEAKRSQKATNPYTWKYKVTIEDENHFLANFTQCGIYNYLNSQGLAEIVPCMCALDYTFGENGNHCFVRYNTIATKGGVCDCHYINKSTAAEEEIALSQKCKEEEYAKGIEIYKNSKQTRKL